MIDFDKEIRKFEKLDILKPEAFDSNQTNIESLDYQKLLSQYDKLNKLYYRVDQDISVIRQDVEVYKDELKLKNQEIEDLRKQKIETSGILENYLRSFAEFSNVIDRAMSVAEDAKNELLMSALRQLDSELQELWASLE